MKPLTLTVACALFLTACTDAPQVNVKEKWSRALINYSFVPLYPARAGVEIGDIRIHRIAKSAATLDSRLFYPKKKNGIVQGVPTEYDTILPGIETFRATQLNGDKLVKQGLFRDLFGVNLESEASLSLALTDLKTAEVADVEVAGLFLKFLDDRLTDPTFLRGLCASAITLGNGELDDIGISLVTRVLKAGGVKYYAGNGASTIANGASKPPDGQPNPTGTDAVEVTARTALALEELSLDKPITIGVDALSITPQKLFGKVGSSKKYKSATLCKDTGFNRFEPSRLDDMRRNLGIPIK